MPVQIGDVPEKIVVSVKNILGDKRGLSVPKMTAYFTKERERGREIVIGEKEKRTPDFQHGKNADCDQCIEADQSPGVAFPNHSESNNDRAADKRQEKVIRLSAE
jgi:hypothetical protein